MVPSNQYQGWNFGTLYEFTYLGEGEYSFTQVQRNLVLTLTRIIRSAIEVFHVYWAVKQELPYLVKDVLQELHVTETFQMNFVYVMYRMIIKTFHACMSSNRSIFFHVISEILPCSRLNLVVAMNCPQVTPPSTTTTTTTGSPSPPPSGPSMSPGVIAALVIFL